MEKQVYTYDGSSWVLETEKSFVYDGWNLIKEQTATGGTTSIDYYVWGMDLSSSLQGAGGIGGLLSKTNNLTSTTFLYTFDANGNVGQFVDSSNGTIAAHYEYDPFGNLVVITGSEADNNVFRFSTKYYDPEAGLYYYGYRYYDPVLGRWVNRDPIEEDGGLNLYGFVENTPVNMFDNIGLYGYPFAYDPINPPWYAPQPGPPVLKNAIDKSINEGINDVQNLFNDPSGFSCTWRGVIDVVTVYMFAGGGSVMMKLESECCDGKRARGNYWVLVGGFSWTFGIPFQGAEFLAYFEGPTPPSHTDPVGKFGYSSFGGGSRFRICRLYTAYRKTH